MKSTATIPITKRFSFNLKQLISIFVVAFGAIAIYFLVNAIIGGKCGEKCVMDTLAQTVRVAAPIALAAYCGVMCERAAVINIGIEGMMLMAAMVGYAVNVYTFSGFKSTGMDVASAAQTARITALVFAVIASGLLAFLHALVSIKFKSDQIISGTVINILAIGLTGYFYRQFLAQDIPIGPGTFPPVDIPLLSQIPYLGAIFFSGQKPIVYLMLILTVAIHYVLFYTAWGLRTRAVGENPRAADTLGINVYRVRYVNV
ncbi:MAG: ABC transporter permease, partial [Chloroflexi bacterium]|nr:ABC transporter permease [Chloroflexota bacterium]